MNSLTQLEYRLLFAEDMSNIRWKSLNAFVRISDKPFLKPNKTITHRLPQLHYNYNALPHLWKLPRTTFRPTPNHCPTVDDEDEENNVPMDHIHQTSQRRPTTRTNRKTSNFTARSTHSSRRTSLKTSSSHRVKHGQYTDKNISAIDVQEDVSDEEKRPTNSNSDMSLFHSSKGDTHTGIDSPVPNK